MMTMDRVNGLRSGWNTTRMLIRGKLTDRKIEKYRKAGWYSAEFKAQRKEMQARAKAKREGNFILNAEGRMIFSPL